MPPPLGSFLVFYGDHFCLGRQDLVNQAGLELIVLLSLPSVGYRDVPPCLVTMVSKWPGQ